MYKGGLAGIELAQSVIAFAKELPKVDVVVAPPFTAIAAVGSVLEESRSTVGLAGQNLYPKNEGAFTGEISGPFLKEAGCAWVILGHSERRQYFAETDAFVADKVGAALGAGLCPIICVGETLEQRERGETLRVVKTQVEAFLDVIARALDGANAPVAIAYEPVWAIGTGKVAGPAEAEEVHQAIRTWLKNKSESLAEKTRILYGGSVKADNAAALLGCPNVDGALVGGASLDAGSFGAIARAAQPS